MMTEILDDHCPTAPLWVHLSFPFLPPSANRLTRTGRIRFGAKKGQTTHYSSDEYTVFQKQTAVELHRARIEWPFDRDALLVLVCRFALPANADVDNRFKALQDTVAKFYGFNDKKLDFVSAGRYTSKQPRTDCWWMTREDFFTYGFPWKEIFDAKEETAK